MNIIFVSDTLTRGRVVSLGRSQVLGLVLFWFLSSIVAGTAAYYFMVPRSDEGQGLFGPSGQTQGRARLQENINAMAARLGQLQAQLFRLDAVGGRLAKHFGLPEQEFNFRQPPGQGGAESAVASRPLDAQQLERELARFAQQLDSRADSLSVLDALTLREQVKQSAFPSFQPVSVGWFTSNFGWRLDPFTGREAYHEGVDFMAQVGTPIRAAAGGVVVYSAYHPQYGNMIDIDHGNGLVTRYAHASKRLVKEGDIVLQGQKIAEVGSTGRSTGPHLHFEVLSKGVAQNPVRYLQTAG